MKQMTELSERPPVYSVTNDNGIARVRFYTDVQEQQREDETIFTAIMWEMSCVWLPTLPARVKNAPEMWLAKVKAITHAEEAAARLEELKATATDDALVDLGEMVAYLSDAVLELATLINM